MSEQKNPLTIAYYGGVWPTNIGNAFIDLGAMAILRAVLPEAQIDFFSEAPRWFFGRGLQPLPTPVPSLGARVRRRLFRRFIGRLPAPTLADDSAQMEKALDTLSLAICDLAVFSGMAMCQEFIDVNGPVILKLARRGVPVLLLGTGGENYTGEERRVFSAFLEEVRPIGFISRDRPSFEMFSPHMERAYEGIDCGFFVPEACLPSKIDLPPYVVATFDSMEEPGIDFGNRIVVRAHHDCWNRIPRNWARQDTLISDVPQDYLRLYCNAEVVHSDRVHACVATLAYRRSAQFYGATPRGALFEAVGAGSIRQGPVQLDPAAISKKKAAQIETVRRWLTEVLGEGVMKAAGASAQ